MPDAFLHHRVHHLLARGADALERQQDGEHVPAVAGVVARRQALGRDEVVARERLEVEMREALALRGTIRRGARAAPGRGARTRRRSCTCSPAPRRRACRRAGARCRGSAPLHRGGLGRVVHDQRAALDGGHVLVGMEAERHEVAAWRPPRGRLRASRSRARRPPRRARRGASRSRRASRVRWVRCSAWAAARACAA